MGREPDPTRPAPRRRTRHAFRKTHARRVQKKLGGLYPVNITLKEFRALAQGAQAIVISGAIIAGVALAWYAFQTYRRSQEESPEPDWER
jgi:hypothetical protein